MLSVSREGCTPQPQGGSVAKSLVYLSCTLCVTWEPVPLATGKGWGEKDQRISSWSSVGTSTTRNQGPMAGGVLHPPFSPGDAHTHSCTHTHTGTHVACDTCAYTHAQLCHAPRTRHTLMPTHVHACTRACIHACTHMCTQSILNHLAASPWRVWSFHTLRAGAPAPFGAGQSLAALTVGRSLEQ